MATFLNSIPVSVDVNVVLVVLAPEAEEEEALEEEVGLLTLVTKRPAALIHLSDMLKVIDCPEADVSPNFKRGRTVIRTLF